VDDLPLKWATDYVPLTTGNSRLANMDVTCFELLTSESRGGRASSVLAVASKSSILIYTAAKGERAFRFAQV
jgi:hypothetical protein